MAAGGHAYLSDFGMSKAFPPGQVIAADQAAGSLDYLAPEQIEGRALDGRADLYSLACTGFELLCGTPPFGPDQGQTLMYAQIYADPPAASARRAGMPAAVDSVLATALAKDPADRYPSCGRFAEELRAALGVRPGERSGQVRPRQAPAVTGHQPAAGGNRSAAEVTSCRGRAAGNRPAADGQRPAVAGDRLPMLRARPALVEERPAAGPVPLGRGAPGEPDGAGPGPSEPRRRALRLVLAAAAVIAVIAAAVSGVALSKRSAPAQSTASSPASRSPSPSSAASLSATSSPSGPVLAAQQAAALEHAADVERRRPDGAASGRRPGRRVCEPDRRGQQAAGGGEPAVQRVRPRVGPGDLGPAGRREGEVQRWSPRWAARSRPTRTTWPGPASR